MEYFQIEKVTTEEEALKEMEEQYQYLCDADSTSARKNRSENMFMLYEQFPILKKVWEYIEDAYRYVQRWVRRAVEKVKEIVEEVITPHDYFYIMRFYRKYWHGKKFIKEFMWDKVGSTKDPDRRMKEHLKKYGADEAELLLCVDTEEIPSTTLEDKVRSYFIRKYGKKNFIAKDRFNCMVDIEDIETKIPSCLQKLREAEIM